MQETSALYKQILASGDYWFDTSLVIGESGRLVDNRGNLITFGGDAILVDNGGADTSSREDILMSVSINQALFKNEQPECGSAISSEIDVEMIAPFNIPKKARMALYVRANNGVQHSEWVLQGVFYIDTREQSQTDTGLDTLKIHGYDAMILSETTCPDTGQTTGRIRDVDLVQFIADNMKPDTSSKSGVPVDNRTWEIMTKGYTFPIPIGYSMREVLCMIAGAYAANFIISPTGELRLVRMFDLPPETRYLITDDGYRITFGNDRILI